MAERDTWYQQAVIYGIDVERYSDGNGDGIGDFAGLANRLDYLAGLGVDCLWLTPFYPTSGHDNGYDITDYYGVDPRLGTLGDFVCFMERAQQFGIRVIVDLVVNHTSREHPWFQKAREGVDGFREYYVWSEEEPEDVAPEVMFPGPQQRNWTWDDQAQAYYLHKFYETQPDLNIESSLVREEILRIVGYWLRLGVSGFRIDAAPHLIETVDEARNLHEDAEWFFDELHEYVVWRSGQAILLAEANVDPERIHDYAQGGDRMQLLFNFIMNQQLVLALVQHSAAPLHEGLRTTGRLPGRANWVQFLRNQDELDLRRLSEQERQQVFEVLAPEERMRVYGRGIKRRLASMLEQDRARIELAYSLLFTLPGTPLLMYGDEIGMGEDLELPERESVRTAMQWAPDEHGGFSSSDVEPHIPMIREGPFGVAAVNVEDQEADRDSLLNWMARLIRARRRHVVLGIGEYDVLDVGDARVFATRACWGNNELLLLHNLSTEEVEVDLPHDADEFRDVFSNREYEVPAEFRAALDPYGYRWFAATHPHEQDRKRA